VIPWARFITIEWVDRPGPSSATIDLGVVECSLLERVICDGRGHRVRLSKQGDTWIVVGEQDTWVT